jgi:hypothetical protein
VDKLTGWLCKSYVSADISRYYRWRDGFKMNYCVIVENWKNQHDTVWVVGVIL